MTSIQLGALLALGFVACKDGKTGEDEVGEAGSTGAASVELYPPVGGQGQTLEVDLTASRSVFTFDGTEVDFGAGITVEAINVDDGWGARALITEADDADLGDRDVYVRTGGPTYELLDSFEVIEQSFQIQPSSSAGETPHPGRPVNY